MYYLNQTTPRTAPTACRIVERKIGRTTFIVASRFNDSKEKDIVSTIVRLIQHEKPRKGA